MVRKLIIAGVSCLALLTAVPAEASAAPVKQLPLRKGLTLTIPKAWKVYQLHKDWMRVVTGACPTKGTSRFGFRDSGCHSFWIMGPAAIKVGHELFNAYDPSGPFYPATDVSPCVYDKKLWTGEMKLAAKGLRQVGKGHKAHYRDWKGSCVKLVTGGAKVSGYYHQREWFLPSSKILIIDQWNTPGLATILKNAAWK